MIYLSSSCVETYNAVSAVERLIAITNKIELSGGSDWSATLLKDLAAAKRRYEIDFLLHNYFPPPREHFLLNLADRGKRTRDFIRESIHTIKSLGIDYYSVHGGFVKDYAVSNEKLFPVEGDVKYTRYDILDAINWFNGEFPRVPLALENMYPVGGAETCFMMEVSEITWLLEHHDSVFLLLDLGHLKISAKYFGFDYLAAAEKLVSDYGDRIIEIHISENDSVTDSHFAVTENSGQYQCIKQYYNRIRRNGTNIVMEIRNSTWDELVASYNLFNSLSGSMNE